MCHPNNLQMNIPYCLHITSGLQCNLGRFYENILHCAYFVNVWMNSYRHSTENQTITNMACFKSSVGSVGSMDTTVLNDNKQIGHQRWLLTQRTVTIVRLGAPPYRIFLKLFSVVVLKLKTSISICYFK